MLVTSHVLLDLDGTLIDSRPGVAASYNAALQALGHDPVAQLDLTALIGPPIADAMASLLSRFTDDRVAEAIAAYRAHYGVTGLFQSAVYAGIPEALQSLHEAGVILYVATSKRVEFARRILGHLGLADRFAGIYGSEPGGKLDQKSELIAHLLEREGIMAASCLMVGDRHYDMTGARANGMRAAGVLWGYGSRAELEAAGADWLVERPAGLLQFASG